MCHFVDEPILVPPSLEYMKSLVGEGASQNTGPNESFDANLEPTLQAQEYALNPASTPSPTHVPAPAHANLITSSPAHSFTALNTPPAYLTSTPIHPSTDSTFDTVHPFSD